jgi:type IV pilus assembly protein PilC
MVEAGEASGALAEILGKVASYFESSVKLSKKVKSAMTYPIAVIGLAIALVNVLLIFVIPVFAEMFADFGSEAARADADADRSEQFPEIQFPLVAMGWAWPRSSSLLQSSSRPRRAADRRTFPRARADLRPPDSQDRAFPLLPHLCDADPSGVPILRTLEIVRGVRTRCRSRRPARDRPHVSQGGQVSEVLATNRSSRR